MQNSFIKIDGVDINQISLQTLRSSLTILPQTPAFFSGSIKHNLDPFNQCSAEQLWDVLECVNLKGYLQENNIVLDEEVKTNSISFSTG